MASSGIKKKLAFYSIMSPGHQNICIQMSKILLDNYGDRIDIYFIVDKVWEEKLRKKDSRFKFGSFTFDNKDNEKRMANLIDKLKASLQMEKIDKLKLLSGVFSKDPTVFEIDCKAEEQIRNIQPDYILMDQTRIMPSVMKIGIPFGFITSENPLGMIIDDLPPLGSGLRVDATEEIRKFQRLYSPTRKEIQAYLYEFFEKRGVKFYRKDVSIDQIFTDHFSIYQYPSVLDYFDDEFKSKKKLWQIDSPLTPDQIPPPYKLPEDFQKLPGKIVFVSLGSGFSAYTDLFTNLLNILEKLPYKYIVSKGPNGDSLKLPSNKFIGENYIDQLGVLQVVDAMISHGGNNSFCESFYFGIPLLVAPVIGDQINNAARIEEKEYGYQIDIANLNEVDLSVKLDKILNDKELLKKWKSASKKIQNDNKIFKVCEKIMNYLEGSLCD